MRWLAAVLLLVSFFGCDSSEYTPARYRIVAEGSEGMRVLVLQPRGDLTLQRCRADRSGDSDLTCPRGRTGASADAVTDYSPWLQLTPGDSIEAVAIDTADVRLSIEREYGPVVAAETARYADLIYVVE